jgi:hypothetical protein
MSGMEDPMVAPNQNGRVVEIQPGKSVYFDNTGLEAPANNIFQVFKKELHEVIQRESGVNHAHLIKYSAVEKYEGKLYLGRENNHDMELRPWESVSLEDTCRALLEILEIIQTYHTFPDGDRQGLVLGGLSQGQLKQDENGAFWLQDPPLMNHIYRSADPVYRVDFAPEVMKGHPWDPSSDVFSWGVLAYQLLGNQDPFQANTLEDRIAKILKAKVIPLQFLTPQLSEELCQLIMDCLVKPARQRPAVSVLIGELTRMVDAGSYQVSAEAAAQYTGKAAGYLKKYTFRENFWLWFRRYGIATSVITGFVLFFLLFGLIAKSKHVLTARTSPEKVVDYYYESIVTLNTPLQDETLYWVKKQVALGNEINKLNLFRDMGHPANLSYADFHGKMLSRTKTKARYRTGYILWVQVGDTYQNIQRTEILTLQPVFGVWRITGIKVLREKRWRTGAKESRPVVGQVLKERYKTAAAISGKRFLCDPNSLHLKSFALLFENTDSCVLDITLDSQMDCQFQVGLDGKYRTTIAKGIGPMAFKGAWDAENIFSLSWYDDFQKPVPMEVRFIFDGKKVLVEFNNPRTGDFGKFQGRLRE